MSTDSVILRNCVLEWSVSFSWTCSHTVCLKDSFNPDTVPWLAWKRRQNGYWFSNRICISKICQNYSGATRLPTCKQQVQYTIKYDSIISYSFMFCILKKSYLRFQNLAVQEAHGCSSTFAAERRWTGSTTSSWRIKSFMVRRCCLNGSNIMGWRWVKAHQTEHTFSTFSTGVLGQSVRLTAMTKASLQMVMVLRRLRNCLPFCCLHRKVTTPFSQGNTNTRTTPTWQRKINHKQTFPLIQVSRHLSRKHLPYLAAAADLKGREPLSMA